MMRMICRAGAALFIAAAMLPMAVPAQTHAQPAGINPAKDCQTIVTCNFRRGGRYRGCLSSYTCRTCKLVRTRCTLAGRRVCEQFVCTWGG